MLTRRPAPPVAQVEFPTGPVIVFRIVTMCYGGSLKSGPGSFVRRSIGLLFFAAVLAGCDSPGGSDLTLSGRVLGGGEPLREAAVTLYEAGSSSQADELGSAFTNSSGEFEIKFSRPSGDGLIYAIARGGIPAGKSAPNGAIALLTVVGDVDRRPESITINELTTIASVWTNAQFLGGSSISGNYVGVRNAAQSVGNFVNIETGGLGGVIQNSVNGHETAALAQQNTLANILASCVALSPSDACERLFAASTPPGVKLPEDTLAAAHNIALNPWHNVAGIFELPGDRTYIPVLNTPPGAWTIALKFTGGGLDAPGGLSIDAEGNAWITNNFLFGSHPGFTDCAAGGTGVTKLDPSGYPLSPTLGFTGGGINGAGFGVAIDETGNIWIGNYQGDSVSLLRPDGTPVSTESRGFRAGGFASKVQGTIIDYEGNVWFVNNRPSPGCPECGNSLTVFPGGDPGTPLTFAYPGTSTLSEPFDAAVDTDGYLWVTNGGGNSITRIDPFGNPVMQTAPGCCGLSEPRGLAIDSYGNVWAANLSGPTEADGGSVTLLDPYGENAAGSPFRGGGTQGPWGIAIDGDDNVWVADFTGKTLVNLCGVRTRNCPGGFATGEPISPPAGYDGGGALQHLTDVAIDQSGNVWVLNNVNDLDVCLSMTAEGCMQASTECGGDGAVVFYGLAAPVKTPMIGPPRQP